MFITYILYSLSRNKYYIGYTGTSIEERVAKHNANHKGFTGKENDWKLMWKEEFATKEESMKRERQIKKMKSRVYLEKLISGFSSVG